MTAAERAEFAACCGKLDADVATAIAIQALQEGHDGKALCELAWTHDSWTEASQHWPAAVAELGLAPLPNPAAVQRVIQAVARRVIAGSLSELDACLAFREMSFWLEVHADDQVGDLAAIAPFKQLYWAFEEHEYYPGQAAEAVLEVRRLASELATTGLEPTLSVTPRTTGLEPTIARPEPPAAEVAPSGWWWKRLFTRR